MQVAAECSEKSIGRSGYFCEGATTEVALPKADVLVLEDFSSLFVRRAWKKLSATLSTGISRKTASLCRKRCRFMCACGRPSALEGLPESRR